MPDDDEKTTVSLTRGQLRQLIRAQGLACYKGKKMNLGEAIAFFSEYYVEETMAKAEAK